MADFEKLDDIIKELEKESNNMIEFNKVYSEVKILKQEISDNLGALKKNNENFEIISEKIQSKLEKSEKQLENFETEMLKKIQELYQDNKNFQKELDNSIVSRLNKHRSDIQVEIRDEGSQIQKAFEITLNKNFNSMESKLKENFSQQLKQLNMLKILLFIIIGIGIGLAVGLYLK